MPPRPDCEFKARCPHEEWMFAPTGSVTLVGKIGRGRGRKMEAPRYGAGQQGIPPAGPRAIVRCPLCNRRLRLRAVHCIGGEFFYWVLPDHKPKGTRQQKSPPRGERARGGRGR